MFAIKKILRKQKVLILILPIYVGHLYLMRFCYQDWLISGDQCLLAVVQLEIKA